MPNTLRSRNFVGDIEQLTFHDDPVGLWNVVEGGTINVQGADQRNDMRTTTSANGTLLFATRTFKHSRTLSNIVRHQSEWRRICCDELGLVESTQADGIHDLFPHLRKGRIDYVHRQRGQCLLVI